MKKGAPVINCHIPSSGPLLPEQVEDSFRQAYQFFGFAQKGETMPLVCESWLLYPPHYELFPESGNMRRFFEHFEVYKHWGFTVAREQCADIGNGFVMDDYVMEKVVPPVEA